MTTTFAQKQNQETNPTTLLIVDAMNLAFRWKPRKPDYVPSRIFFVDEFVSTIKSLAKSYKAGKIIVTADWGGSDFRKSLYPEYKANRKELADAQTPAEREISKLFFDEYERLIEHLYTIKDIVTLRYKGVEADDIAAYLTTHLDVYGYTDAWLISSDRDWDLLVTDNVSRFSTVSRREITMATWEHPVSPEDYISLKVLMGDPGDNVPGISGIGPVRGAKLIQEYGTAYDIYAACPLPGKSAYINNINEQRERILLNYDLMDLVTNCKAAIGQDNVMDIARRLTFD